MSFINWGSESPEQLAIRQQLEQMALFEQVARVRAMRAGNAGGVGGGRLSNPQLPANSIEFVLNTSQYLDFELALEVTQNTTYTVDWGDGTVQNLSLMANVNNTVEYSYSTVGQYTVRITFANALLVRELNFEGTSEEYATLVSIDGLTNLSNLVEFRADWNELSSIDLSGLSNLVYLDVSDNSVDGNGLSSINLTGCTSLETLLIDDNNFSAGLPNLTGLTSLINIDFDGCEIVGSVDISNLPNLERFDFNDNPGLTELIISSTQPLGDNGNELDASGCALTESSIDSILVALSQNSVNNGYVNLSGGTNAIPGTAGAAALTVLTDPNPGQKGWSVDYND